MICRERSDLRIDNAHAGAVAHGEFLPAESTFDVSALPGISRCWIGRPGRRLADHHFAQADRRGIRRAVVHAAPHVGIDRQIDRANQEFARPGRRHGRLDQLEIRFLRKAGGPRGQRDLSIDGCHVRHTIQKAPPLPGRRRCTSSRRHTAPGGGPFRWRSCRRAAHPSCRMDGRSRSSRR